MSNTCSIAGASATLSNVQLDMRHITLTKGRVAIVDDADYEVLSRKKWSCGGNGHGNIYAFRTDNKRTVFMHRVIIDAKNGETVDHKNGNGLDNRRMNLRTCTNSQNSMNRIPKRKRIYSSLKGITRDKTGRWKACIYVDKKRHHLGMYDKAEDAASAYDSAATKYFGEFARLNSQVSPYPPLVESEEKTPPTTIHNGND
jgi:hypothetical protein